MSAILFISYVLSIAGSLVLILFVYQKRKLSPNINAFVYFGAFTTLWQISAFASELLNGSARLSHITTNISIAVGTIMALYFYRFCKTFFDSKQLNSLNDIFLLLITVLFAFTAGLNKIVEVGTNGVLVFGSLYSINTFFNIFLFAAGALFLIRKSIKEKSSRAQVRYLFSGLMVALIVNIVTGYVMLDSPLLSYFIWLSPLSIFVMVAFFMATILRHNLFDIRPVVARAVSYLLVSTLVATLYVAVGFVIKVVIAPETNIFSLQYVANIVLTTVLVLLYPSVKKIFDKLTNAIFYRDAYDPQAFIGSLNKILVSSIDIEKLLASSSTVIEKNLKAQFCNFYIVGTQYAGSRVIGDYSKNLKLEDIDLVQKLLPGIPDRIIYVELGNGTEHSNAVRILKKNDVEVFARLTTISKGISKEIGYLLLGPKKSGNLYTPQDLKMIEIVANELVIAVENALRFEEIEQFNVTLQNKIDQATSQLKRTNKKLQTLDEAKDEFISMASHQLRTPLTSIKGYLSMVLEGDVGPVPDQQKEMLTTAFTSAQRMVYLIADLLNVSRLQTGKFIIEPSECYLPDLITDELAQLRESLTAKNINVVYDQPANFPKLKLDETKIRQVMMNFIDNSLYYTPDGGTVTISLIDKPKEIEFTVKDTGIGVPRSEQHKLFTKFYRAGNARKARPDGTGLGLFMAKKVIIASGGAVVFKSTEGKGSTFGFTFPKK